MWVVQQLHQCTHNAAVRSADLAQSPDRVQSAQSRAVEYFRCPLTAWRRFDSRDRRRCVLGGRGHLLEGHVLKELDGAADIPSDLVETPRERIESRGLGVPAEIFAEKVAQGAEVLRAASRFCCPGRLAC